MAPIRIAFIGLSANRGWAQRAHLPYLQQTSKYEIVGVCNSSKESSEAAIKAFNLPASTKAYGSPEEVADDSDSFDLAVCSVRVPNLDDSDDLTGASTDSDKHLSTMKPVALKGKQCYVEWPLARNLSEAQELRSALISAGGGVRTIVGLQGRSAPVVRKLKSLLATGAIGRVVSSSLVSSAGNVGAVDPEALGVLFNDASIACNMLTIHFGHMVDYVLFAHGQELKTLNAILSTQFPTPGLRLDDGTVKTGKRDTPDQILLQGHLSGGAVLSIHQRGGAPFKGEPGLRWRIFGEKGEIQVTAAGSLLSVGYDDIKIELFDHETDEVRVVDVGVEDELNHLPLAARNVSRVYEAFADGRREYYADWDEAVARHRLQDKIIESSTKGVSVSL